jgi:hypothetical protein
VHASLFVHWLINCLKTVSYKIDFFPAAFAGVGIFAGADGKAPPVESVAAPEGFYFDGLDSHVDWRRLRSVNVPRIERTGTSPLHDFANLFGGRHSHPDGSVPCLLH